MKNMNNCYGQSKIDGKVETNLQLFAEDEEEEIEDEEEEEEKGDDKKKKERVYTKKELGAIVAKEVAKAIAKKEADDKKGKSEAEKLENMTDEQKKVHEQKQKDDEVAELKRKVVRMEMSKTASKALKEVGIEATDDILDFVLCDDAETTSENIEKFAAIKDAIVLAAEKERNTGKTPKVVTNADGGKKTKIDVDDLNAHRIVNN